MKRYGISHLAEKIQHRWLKINEDVFNLMGKMFEKYDVYDTSLQAEENINCKMGSAGRTVWHLLC